MLNQPGWAVRLTGNGTDICDLRDRLPAPFDPWVEDNHSPGNSGLMLRSHRWEKLTSARDVSQDAERILERLHGEALLYDAAAKRVEPGLVYEFRPDGTCCTTVLLCRAEASAFALRMRVTQTSSAPDDDASQRSATETQRWFEEAEADDLRAQLFTHVSRYEGWFDIYKVMELMRRILGNDKKLQGELGGDKQEWIRIWRTANHHRHAPNPAKYPLPAPPAELDESWSFVLKVVRRLI